METVLALARCAATGKLSPFEFRKNLKIIRYREGKIYGYSSRLHYFTDWLRENEKKKIVMDVSRRLGGMPQRKKINFMSTHRKLYGALKSDIVFQKMQIIESNLSRKISYVVDKDKIGTVKSQIQNGDIIAFTTREEGLDVAHVGFAVRQGKSLRLLHASSKEGGIVISRETLAVYLKSNKKFTGIIIARFS